MILRFALPEVLELADHAMTAPAHADPVDAEAAGPALLLITDDGAYLLSNGDPQLPPAASQPPSSAVRAVFAHGYGSSPRAHQPPGWPGEVLVPFPLTAPRGRPLIDMLHAAAALRFDTFTVDFRPDRIRLRLGRRHRLPGCARPAVKQLP